MTRMIHVVSFSPAHDQGGVGGFEWRPDLDDAKAEYDHQVAESKECEDSHNVRLVTLTVRDGLSVDETTAVLEARLDEIEDGAPALWQYIPADSPYVPSGGLVTDNPTED